MRRCVGVRLGRWSVAVVAVAGMGAGVPAGPAWADDSGGGTRSVPVSFDVVTTNRSGLPCDPLTLGARHVTLRGHLTGPAEALHSDSVEGTVYSHGDGYDESFYRYHGDDSGHYNYVEQMARRGHVSVSFDRLGYGRSDRPNGNSSCFGDEADMLHQVIQRLRDGDYQGQDTPRFERVGLVGHSASGLIAEQEAGGFHDVDALGVLDSGEASAKPLVAVRTLQEQARCPLDADGYVPLEGSDAEFRSDHLDNVEPDVGDYLTANRTNDACAGLRNAPLSLGGNAVRNSTISVPVLVLGGANDQFFGNFALQGATYTRSPKVTVRTVPDTGHAVAFSRNAGLFQDDMDAWLDQNRL